MSDHASAMPSAGSSQAAPPPGGPPPFSFGSFTVGLTVGVVVGLFGGVVVVPLLEPLVRGRGGIVTVESANPQGKAIPAATPEEEKALLERRLREGEVKTDAPPVPPADAPPAEGTPAPEQPKAPEKSPGG
jgi:hypothetical protein